MENIKHIFREVEPEATEFSFYFDDDEIKVRNTALYLIDAARETSGPAPHSVKEARPE